MSADGRTLAAVDLGSNSFHMVVARVRGDGTDFEILDRLKRPVRLRDGLGETGNLSPEAQARALGCLGLFGQRLAGLPREDVRAVGTNTLRRARNSLPFLVRARKALGHKIEVISGREEARLIYRGVAHELTGEGRRLVVDIGGGSTELIVGEGTAPLELTSRELGCVSWTHRHFARGRITPKAFTRAVTAAQLHLQDGLSPLRALGWQQAVGSSGTIRAIGKVSEALGCGEDITPAGLAKVRDAVLACGSSDRLKLEGLSASRAPVFAGGLAVMCAVFDAVGIQRLTPARYALREGVLVQMLGRLQSEDPRDGSVRTFANRTGVDLAHSLRVAETALALFDQVEGPWNLTRHRHRPLLRWAALLHECGIFVTHNGHHRHGAYLLRHSDLPGFSRADQAALGTLVLCHRKPLTMRKVEAAYPGRPQPILQLAILLRLAVRLHRSRSERALPELRLSVHGNTLRLGMDRQYLTAHPLTAADLEEEQAELRSSSIKLELP